MPSNKVLQRGPGAAVGDESELGFGRILEKEPANMSRGAHARSGDVCLVRLQPIDKLAEVRSWQGAFRDDELRGARQHCDRGQVSKHIVLERMHGTVEHMRAPVADADRVSVRCGVGHATDANSASGARNVLDDDWLAKVDAHGLRNDAGERVKRTSRSKRYDKRYRLGRVAVGQSRADAGERGKCADKKLSHVLSPARGSDHIV